MNDSTTNPKADEFDGQGRRSRLVRRPARLICATFEAIEADCPESRQGGLVPAGSSARPAA